MTLTVAVLVLAFIGLMVSLYFTLAYYGRVRSDKMIPAVTTGGTCRSILDTPYARVLGLPNSVFGLAYYIAVIVAASCRLVRDEWIGLTLLAVVSVFAAVFSVYLAWALLFRVRVLCPLCVLAQVVNIALAILIIAAC